MQSIARASRNKLLDRRGQQLLMRQRRAIPALTMRTLLLLLALVLLLLVPGGLSRKKKPKRGFAAGRPKLSATELIQAGVALGQAGRMPEAISTMELAVETSPDFAEGHYNLGIAFDRARRTDEALASFRTALRLKPSLPVPTALSMAEAAAAASSDEHPGEKVAACLLATGVAPARRRECEGAVSAAHNLHVGYMLVGEPLLAPDRASALEAVLLKATAPQDEKVAQYPTYVYRDGTDGTAPPVHQAEWVSGGLEGPMIIETSTDVSRTTRELPKAEHQQLYERMSAAVSEANAKTWQFPGLVLAPLPLMMADYSASDRRDAIGGWYRTATFNESTFSQHGDGAAFEMLLTYTQLSADAACGDGHGVQLEFAGGELVTLRQGKVLVIPSYAIYRVLPSAPALQQQRLAAAAAEAGGVLGCQVVEGVYLGLDREGTFRGMAAMVAGERAVAAQPHREKQLRLVLSDTSSADDDAAADVQAASSDGQSHL
jgi:tetratricopeptide (TPR) repeat protein